MAPHHLVEDPAFRLSRILRYAVPAWIVTTAYLLWTAGPELAHSLGDPDDALRLQQVRDLLGGGQGWYDLVQHRFNPPYGVFIHWSRLIDLPVAGLILLFEPFLGAEAAETWTRALWPTLSILPLVAACGVVADRLGGRRAASVAMAFACVACTVISLPKPGHLYHHNVQLAAAMVLFACLMVETRRSAIVAGLVAALMLAVGMETMPYVALACAFVAVRWAWLGTTGACLRGFFASFAAAAVLCFASTVAPSLWRTPACDMISPLYLVPLATGAAGFAAWSRAVERVRWRRVALVAAVAAAVVALVAVLNPICLKGPYAAVDPLLFEVWMNKVGEARSALDVFREDPAEMLAVFAIPTVALLAGAAMPPGRHRRPGLFYCQVALVAMAFLVSLWQVRAVAFDAVFAIPLLAVVLVRAASVSVPPKRSALALPVLCCLVNPMTLPLYGMMAGSVIATNRPSPAALDPAADHCTDPHDYVGLAALPPGTVAAPVEIGSFIIATTPHSVLAAPYHRDRTGILDVHALLTGSDADAHRLVQQRGVDYVAYCSRSADPARWATGGAYALEGRLERGDAPPWLERVAAPGPLRLYRVLKP